MVTFNDSFLISSRKYFYLRWRSQSRISLIKQTIGYSIYIVSLFLLVPVATFLYRFQLFEDFKITTINNLDEINYKLVIPFYIMGAGFFILKPISQILDDLVETIVFCFIADEEMFSGKQRFAIHEFTEFMNSIGCENDLKNETAKNRRDPFFKQDNENIDQFFNVKKNQIAPLNLQEDDFNKVFKIGDEESEEEDDVSNQETEQQFQKGTEDKKSMNTSIPSYDRDQQNQDIFSQNFQQNNENFSQQNDTSFNTDTQWGIQNVNSFKNQPKLNIKSGQQIINSKQMSQSTFKISNAQLPPINQKKLIKDIKNEDNDENKIDKTFQSIDMEKDLESIVSISQQSHQSNKSKKKDQSLINHSRISKKSQKQPSSQQFEKPSQQIEDNIMDNQQLQNQIMNLQQKNEDSDDDISKSDSNFEEIQFDEEINNQTTNKKLQDKSQNQIELEKDMSNIFNFSNDEQ